MRGDFLVLSLSSSSLVGLLRDLRLRSCDALRDRLSLDALRLCERCLLSLCAEPDLDRLDRHKEIY